MKIPLSPNDPCVHVFSVSPDGGLRLAHQTYLSRLSEPADATPLAEAFGAPVDTTYAEVFSLADIAPMTLRDYLAQAHDIPTDTLEQEAHILDPLRGDVVILAPKALAGIDVLRPHPALRPVADLAPAEVNDAPVKLPPAAREPSIALPAEAGNTAPSGRVIGAVVVSVLALVALLLILV